MTLDYATYLKLPTLLSLQNSDDHIDANNELLFIAVHQAEELYFKVLLSELQRVCNDFMDNDVFAAISRFERCTAILVSLAKQLSILECLSPMQFFKFRGQLGTSSGFQSCQFRGLIFLLGQKRRELVSVYKNPAEHDWLVKTLNAPSLLDYFYQFLTINGHSIDETLLQRDYRLPNEPNETVQAAIRQLHMTRPDIRLLFEKMLDFDTALQHWRYQHCKLVERTIGSSKGTGGSSGVDFLRTELFKTMFTDLWAIRDTLNANVPAMKCCPIG